MQSKYEVFSAEVWNWDTPPCLQAIGIDQNGSHPLPQASSCKHSSTKQQWRYFLNDPFLSLLGSCSPCLLPCAALRVLSLTLFQSTIRYSCFSVLDGQDFHLRHHHIQKDASICPPSWLVCIIACLSLFIADAKSLQMPHHFLFSVPVIFQPFFPLVCIIIICPERALSERGLFVLQPGTQLFSGSTVFFPSPSVQLNTPGKFAFVSDISFFFLSCWPLSISPHQFKTLPRYCQSFWSLIVSTVFFAQRCLKDI